MHKIVTFSQDKVLPVPLMCLKVIVLKSLLKDDSIDILGVPKKRPTFDLE